jgi:hypothetical protein
MRTEDDLRAALSSLEQHAPDALAVLTAVRTKGAARQVINHRRASRSLLAAAAAASVAAVATAAALVPGVFRPATQNGPTVSAGTAASVLRQLATAAAGQPTPALGPVLYTKEALWGPGAGAQRKAAVLRGWIGAAATYFVEGRSASYTKYDPRNNPDWNWRNPATLPTSQVALRRHLLGLPDGRPVGPRLTLDERVFGTAVSLMTSEPLRPAGRASMLGLLAGIARRASREFVVFGTITDRAGRRDIAIGVESVQSGSTALVVYYFDPVTGVLRAGEHATCTGRVSTFQTFNARCTVGSYEQYLVVKAVRSLPTGASATKASVLAPYVPLPWQQVIP